MRFIVVGRWFVEFGDGRAIQLGGSSQYKQGSPLPSELVTRTGVDDHLVNRDIAGPNDVAGRNSLSHPS